MMTKLLLLLLSAAPLDAGYFITRQVRQCVMVPQTSNKMTMCPGQVPDAGGPLMFCPVAQAPVRKCSQVLECQNAVKGWGECP